ncbi:hypothetical protein AT5A_24450 [Agrobacterium tumefaciens 5A]|nr:hypothetical protein AT5A_24450 [Agrobacterium tumefaciens 5A]
MDQVKQARWSHRPIVRRGFFKPSPYNLLHFYTRPTALLHAGSSQSLA